MKTLKKKPLLKFIETIENLFNFFDDGFLEVYIALILGTIIAIPVFYFMFRHF